MFSAGLRRPRRASSTNSFPGIGFRSRSSIKPHKPAHAPNQSASHALAAQSRPTYPCASADAYGVVGGRKAFADRECRGPRVDSLQGNVFCFAVWGDGPCAMRRRGRVWRFGGHRQVFASRTSGLFARATERQKPLVVRPQQTRPSACRLSGAVFLSRRGLPRRAAVGAAGDLVRRCFRPSDAAPADQCKFTRRASKSSKNDLPPR